MKPELDHGLNRCVKVVEWWRIVGTVHDGLLVECRNCHELGKIRNALNLPNTCPMCGIERFAERVVE